MLNKSGENLNPQILGLVTDGHRTRHNTTNRFTQDLKKVLNYPPYRSITIRYYQQYYLLLPNYMFIVKKKTVQLYVFNAIVKDTRTMHKKKSTSDHHNCVPHKSLFDKNEIFYVVCEFYL